MKFTFITTTYNTKISDFQKMCDSLLNLKYEDWNIFYADDGSTKDKKNEYFKILNQINKKHLHIFENFTNVGICALKDTLISHFRDEIGEYIISLDSDDYIYNEFLSNLDNQIENWKPDIIKFNTFDFMTDENCIYFIEEKRKLLNTNHVFRRIYQSEYNQLNSSKYLLIKNLPNCNQKKIMRFANFSSSRICGPISTIFKSEFFIKNNLQYTLDSEEKLFDISPNLDFRPVLECNNIQNTELILNTSNYCYRKSSESSVSKTFANKDCEINKIIINIFVRLINSSDTDDISYTVFTYYLYIRYMLLDSGNLFKKELRKYIKPNKLTGLSKIEKIAFRFSGNKLGMFIFSLLSSFL